MNYLTILKVSFQVLSAIFASISGCFWYKSTKVEIPSNIDLTAVVVGTFIVSVNTKPLNEMTEQLRVQSKDNMTAAKFMIFSIIFDVGSMVLTWLM